MFTTCVIRLTHWSLGLTAPADLTDAFFDSQATSAPGDRRRDTRLLAGCRAIACSRLDLQLFLDGRGQSLPVAATRCRRHSFDGDRAARFGYGTIARLTHSPIHRPLTKSPSKTVLITGQFGFEQQVVRVFFVAVGEGHDRPGRPTCRA